MQFRCTSRLPVALIGLWCLLTAHGISPAAAGVESAAKPSLSIPSTSFDFGEVMEGAQVEHDFVVKNTGSAVLEIRKVSRD